MELLALRHVDVGALLVLRNLQVLGGFGRAVRLVLAGVAHLEGGGEPVASPVAGLVGEDLDVVVAGGNVGLGEAGDGIDLLRRALRADQLGGDVVALVVELDDERAFGRERQVPETCAPHGGVVDGVLHLSFLGRAGQIARGRLRLAGRLRLVGILRLEDGPNLDARLDRILPRLLHEHVIDAGLQLGRLDLLARLALGDRLRPGPLGVDGHRHLRLRIDRLGGGDERPWRWQFEAEPRDVMVVVVAQRRVHLLAERPVDRLVRDAEPRRAGEREPARVAAREQEEREDSSKGLVHRCPFPVAWSASHNLSACNSTRAPG